ncbi:MAG: hypothetical protein HY645_08120 [Acidobacteria bacterium]|nr:hypothetical protein [Acidobacteriota bacterium]
MKLEEALQELLDLEERDTLFLSVYLNTTVNQEGRRTHLTFLNKKLRELMRESRDHNATEDLRQLKESLEWFRRYLTAELHEETRGVVLFASPGRSFYRAFQLPVPLPNKVSAGRSPSLDALIELAEGNQHYCIVQLDQHSGKIYSVYLYDILESRELQDPLVPGRFKMGGWSQKRFERHRNDLIQHFMKDLADLLEKFVRKEKPDNIALLGTQENVSEFRKHLSHEVKKKVSLVQNAPADLTSSEVVLRLKKEIEKQGDSGQVVLELYDCLTHDYKAVVGVEETLSHLQMGKLDRIVVSSNLNGRCFRCKKCGFFFGRKSSRCTYCNGAIEEVGDLRSHLEKMAEARNVKIEVVHERTFLDSMGGTGGFLKF